MNTYIYIAPISRSPQRR